MASCKVKYDEGFIQMFGHIVTKPEILWTQADRDLITPTGILYYIKLNSFYSHFLYIDYSLCIGFSLQM
jgi:hypothetical protein